MISKNSFSYENRQKALWIFVKYTYICAPFFLYGSYVGKKNGYMEGVAATISDTWDDADMKATAAKNYDDGYGRGIYSAKIECDQIRSIDKVFREDELKKAFALGQINGMKRAAKVCGIKLK